MAPRLLLASLCLAAGADAYKTRDGPVVPVAPADRVADTQLFARVAEILEHDPPLLHIRFSLDVRGRVFVSYVDKPSNSTGVYGKIKFSGSAEELVGCIGFTAFEEDSTTEAFVMMDTPKNSLCATTSSDSLLIEIELYHKNVLKEIGKYGGNDVVVLENVLHAPPSGVRNDILSEKTLLSINSGSGSLFVVDPTTEFTGEGFAIMNSGNDGTIQVEVASLNSTGMPTSVTTEKQSNVTLFVDTLSPINFLPGRKDGEESLCIASKNDVDMTVTNVYAAETTVETKSPGGGSCIKLSVPERVPAKIGSYFGIRGVSGVPTTKAVRTSAPDATTPSPAATTQVTDAASPTPTTPPSSASKLAATGLVAMLVIVALLG